MPKARRGRVFSVIHHHHSSFEVLFKSTRGRAMSGFSRDRPHGPTGGQAKNYTAGALFSVCAPVPLSSPESAPRRLPSHPSAKFAAARALRLVLPTTMPRTSLLWPLIPFPPTFLSPPNPSCPHLPLVSPAHPDHRAHRPALDTGAITQEEARYAASRNRGYACSTRRRRRRLASLGGARRRAASAARARAAHSARPSR